ncbi:MAG: right-handed parallel beta-helix repeat-containing protein [Planctomycetota bacterium]|jgi:hypothetical protein
MCERKRFNVAATITVFLAVLSLCGVARGKIIYVDAAAAGGNNGSSWADAYNHLQDALADANIAENPIEIHIAQGLYTPDLGEGITPGDRSAEFKMLNDLTVRGGFAGFSELDPDARDFEKYETILSGDLEGNDVEVASPSEIRDEPTRSDNSMRIISLSDSEVNIELDGLTLTAGGTAIDKFTRGKLNISRGNLTITDCTFESNRNAVFHSGEDLTVTNCTFNNNWGKWLWIYSFDRFRDHFGEVKVHNCIFTGNFATDRISALDCNADKLTLSHCRFTGNTPGDACVKATINRDSIVENCVFTGNTGTAIGQSSGRLFISNCVFAGNRGHAVEARCMYATIRNCTFSDDQVYRHSTTLFARRRIHVSNSIFWGNSSPLIDLSYQSPPFGRSQFVEIQMDHCNIEGGWPGVGNIDVDPGFAAQGHWEQNGTPDDPDDDYWIEGNYHLLSQAGRWDPMSMSWVQDHTTSPCIDAGDPNGPIGREPFPNGGRVNMGAYGASEAASKTYFGGPVCDIILAGDINGDCVVDFNDLVILTSHWMMRGEDFVNKPPVVTLIEPQDGALITPSDSTWFRAEAHDPDGEVTGVSFHLQRETGAGMHVRVFLDTQGFNGWGKKFDVDSSQGLNSGIWTLWVEATDNEGAVGVTPSIVITLILP